MAFVCWRNDLLIPLRCAPHACSGRRALSELRPTVLEAFRRRRRTIATARTAHISTNQGDVAASRLGAVSVLLRPGEPRKSEGPIGVELHSGRNPNPRCHVVKSKNVLSGSLILFLLPLGYADQYAPGIRVAVCCVVLRRSDKFEFCEAIASELGRGFEAESRYSHYPCSDVN
jgi:hypothetical protein